MNFKMKYSFTYNFNADVSVLVTLIHQISNNIHKDTLKGGADTIRVNSKTYWKCIVPILDHVYPRYSIESSNEFEENIVIVTLVDEPEFTGQITIE